MGAANFGNIGASTFIASRSRSSRSGGSGGGKDPKTKNKIHIVITAIVVVAIVISSVYFHHSGHKTIAFGFGMLLFGMCPASLLMFAVSSSPNNKEELIANECAATFCICSLLSLVLISIFSLI